MLLTEILESTKIALEQIFSSKMKSFLSALGVVIGISVVIIMGWLVMALDDVVESTFESIGSDMLWVSRWSWAGGLTWEDMRNRKKISLKLCDEFKAQMQSADIVTISGSSWGNGIKYNNEIYQGISVESGDYEYQFTNSGIIVDGRYFSHTELEYGAQVVLLGDKVYTTIFPQGGAIGRRITILGRHFTVIGVLQKQGTIMMDFVDNRVVLPLNTFTKVYGKDRDYDIGVKAGNNYDLDEVRAETQGIMRSLRGIKPGEKDDFSINESKVFEEQTQAIRASVYGIGIGMTMLSFIVGIIGVMNIMFVSVTERITEIGTRKAVGARRRSILLQFIIESAVLCFIGALVSFVFCSILIYTVATVLPKYFPETSFLTPYLPLNLLILASVISLAVGVIAGVVPAMRAAKLSPIEALRWE